MLPPRGLNLSTQRSRAGRSPAARLPRHSCPAASNPARLVRSVRSRTSARTAGNVPKHCDQPIAAIGPCCSRRCTPCFTDAVERVTLPLDRDRSPDVEAASRCIVSASENAAHTDRLPGPPGVATRDAFAATPLAGADAAPELEVLTPRSVHHLVPYRLDTPTITQVAPRDDRIVSGGWTSRHPLVTRSAQRCQLRLERQFRRHRRNPTSASPTVTTGSTRCILCGRKVSFRRRNRNRTVWAFTSWRSEESLDGSFSRSRRCETSVRHRGGFQRQDRVAAIPTDQHVLPRDPGEPITAHSQLERVETHVRRNRAMDSRSTTSRRTNRNLEATDWTRPKACPRLTSNNAVMSPSPRFAPRVPNESRTCSNHQTTVDERVAPSTDGFEVGPPRGVDQLQNNLFQPSPKTLRCLAFGLERRVPAVHDGKPDVPPTVGRPPNKRRRDPRDPHECRPLNRSSSRLVAHRYRGEESQSPDQHRGADRVR